MKKKLLLLSFIEGAAVMAAELCGAKLLAPIFGSSLYVWASVMGITLAALALGYFFGGKISALKKDHSRALYHILVLASIFIVLMPACAYYLLPRVSYLPFLPGVVTGTILLLFFPVFFLGATSPLFISVQTNEQNLSGSVSGTVYAVSTFGGILATFLCGFYLIPVLGLNACLLFFGGVLLICSFIVFRKGSLIYFLFFLIIILFTIQFSVQKFDSVLKSDGILGRLQVRDIFNGKDSIRYLKINDIIQTEMSLSTRKSVSDYVKMLDTLIPTSKTKSTALVLGLGGGLTANLLEEKNYRTLGVEFDERVIGAAKAFFFLNPEVQTVHADARFFINRCEEKFQIILTDLFKAEEQPSHVLTVESLEKIKQMLNPKGLLLINWHGYVKGFKGKGTSILLSTLVKSGFEVKLCSTSDDEDYRNVMLVASLQKLQPLPFEINSNIANNAPVNSDNFPRLEKYNAAANKAWRANYLRYYQGRQKE